MRKYLQTIIAFIVIAVLLLQVVTKFSIVVNYAINKEYIAKVLCENKEKPKMQCNGKCHLKKQLEKQEKKEKPTSNSAKEKFEVQYFTEMSFNIDCESVYFETRKFNSIYKAGFSCRDHRSVFHPPQV